MFVFVCSGVYICLYRYLRRIEEGYRFFGGRITGDCEVFFVMGVKNRNVGF